MAARALHLDFIRPAPASRLVGTVLLAAGVLLVAWVLGEARALQEERDRWQVKREDTYRLAKRALPSLASPGTPSRETTEALKGANQILDQLTLPWDRLFRDLESAVVPDVAMLGIQPDPAKRRVTIAGEARNLAGLLTYLARLDATPELGDAHLTQHEVRINDPRRPIAFTIEARWMPRP
jgi:hypothetical protein